MKMVFNRVFDIVLDINSENLSITENKLINSISPNPVNEETILI